MCNLTFKKVRSNYSCMYPCEKNYTVFLLQASDVNTVTNTTTG